MKEVQQLLGFRLKNIRKSKKISQEELAELMDISVTSISNIETGKRAISLKTLEKLSKVLNIKIYELFLFSIPFALECLVIALNIILHLFNCCSEIVRTLIDKCFQAYPSTIVLH